VLLVKSVPATVPIALIVLLVDAKHALSITSKTQQLRLALPAMLLIAKIVLIPLPAKHAYQHTP
jgi:hypothetical protein